MLAKKLFVTALFASSAVALAFATPVSAADKTDRAQEAIAAADAKIHTAESLGTGVDAPRETADARAALAMAREDLKSHHRSEAIEAAIHASALADTAIGDLQRHQAQASAAARESQRDAVAAAQDQAATAQQQAATAQQQAADANARADAAQDSAARSAADAAAARDAAAHLAAQPPQVQTSVTTQQTTGVHHATHTVVKRRATTTTAPVTNSSSSVTTTTTVSPQPQP
jgi:hypothetical protein